MNLSEFKAWFEGFTEGMTGLPTKAKWARIQERVAEITPEPTPYPVFIDRYVRPYWPWWQWGGNYTATISDKSGPVTSNTIVTTSDNIQFSNNTLAFNEAGRAEALSITA